MWNHKLAWNLLPLFLGAALLSGHPSALYAQTKDQPRPRESSLQEHYDAAETLQQRGDLTQATAEYKQFLAEALHHIANGRAYAGQYPEAVPLFDEASTLAPSDTSVRMDYAQAALAARDLPKAQRLAKELLDSLPKGSRDSRAEKLHRLLGNVLLGTDDNQGAKQQFETAVAINSNFENGYALSQAYLALLDKQHAAKIFAEMLRGFGDSAGIHMQFGTAYLEADFPEEAIREIRKALEKDDKLPEAHYALGAAYLQRSGDTAFPQAEAEFRKELVLNPDYAFSYYELGYIAMRRHNLQEAAADLSRSAQLDPRSPDTFLMLGDVYGQLDKPADQETALRNAIAVTTDPSRNHYQIRGAHYQLGLLLIKRGEKVEGKKEMQAAQDLLLENKKLDVANLAGKPILRFPSPKRDGAPANAAIAAELAQFEKRVGPAVADSFNNLGAITAERQDYETASGYFEQATRWNPAMPELDYNWGRAAFAAKQYRQAVICLSRYMQAHPEDNRPRVSLGMSQFELADYKATIDTLSPLRAQLDSVPLLAYAYAESLVKIGDVRTGIASLQLIEQSHPELGIVPLALGKAFIGQGEYRKAEQELRTGVRLDPANTDAKYSLALDLIALKQEDEAQALLTEMAKARVNNPAVYFQLGELQFEHGYTDSAISNFEIASRLDPDNDTIHRVLDEARRHEKH